MKNLIFCFLFVISWSIVFAQEITVASIIDTKSNAEWLESSVLGDKPILLNESDLKVVNKVISRLKVGKGLSNGGLVLTPVYFSGGVLTTFQGAFTRMPAHRKLSKFIDNRYSDTILKNTSYTDLNLEHLLAAEKHLDKAQTVSYIAIGVSVLNVIFTSQLIKTADGWDGLGYFFMGVITFNLTNSIATGINLSYTSKAIRELRKIH